MRNNLSDKLGILGLVATALVGSYLIWYATSWGPWAGSDSVEYLEAARNLSTGLGLVLVRASGAIRPLSLRPPFYSILLSSALFLKIDVLLFARFLNIAIYITLIVGMGTWLARILNSTFASAAIISLIALSSFAIWIFSGMMTEPLFVALTFFGLINLYKYYDHGKVQNALIAGLFAGLAWLTKLSGVVLVLLGILVIIGKQGESKRSKVVSSIMYTLFAVSPVAFWMMRNHQLGSSVGVYDFSISNLWSSLAPVRVAIVNAFWEWTYLSIIFPITEYRSRLYVLGFMIFLLGAVTIYALTVRKHSIKKVLRNSEQLRFAILLTIFSICYLLFIATSYVFVVFPKPALNTRILWPAQLTFTFSMLIILYSFFSNQLKRKPLNVFLLIPFIYLLWIQIPPSISRAVGMHSNGGGYTSPGWQSSDLIRRIGEFPQETPIISSDIDVIMFYLKRPAFRIGELQTGTPVYPFSRYGDNREDPTEILFVEQCVPLVIFQGDFWKFYDLYGEETEERLHTLTEGLQHIWAGDGDIYFAPDCGLTLTN
jgi:hypothetical protein